MVNMKVIFESANPLLIVQWLGGYENIGNKQVVLENGIWKILEVA